MYHKRGNVDYEEDIHARSSIVEKIDTLSSCVACKQHHNTRKQLLFAKVQEYHLQHRTQERS